jgi:hypothetical protein
MEAGLNLLENPLVFVACPRHVSASCSDQTLPFFLVFSVGCMIFLFLFFNNKKKLGGFNARFLLKVFSYLMYISLFRQVLSALINYTFIWLRF